MADFCDEGTFATLPPRHKRLRVWMNRELVRVSRDWARWPRPELSVGIGEVVVDALLQDVEALHNLLDVAVPLTVRVERETVPGRVGCSDPDHCPAVFVIDVHPDAELHACRLGRVEQEGREQICDGV